MATQPTNGKPQTALSTVTQAVTIPIDLIIQLITWILKLIFKIP